MNNILLSAGEHRVDLAATPDQHQILFVGGLHRSGTSMISRSLGQHPMIGTLQNTNVPEDEGQHLQDVYPAGRKYGGPGKFGFAPGAHITEQSPLANHDNALRMWRQWLPYWDAQRPYFAEKSPPNLIRSRFLQALFPQTYFLMIVRHPIAVSLATQKWSWTPLESLLAHWHKCYQIMREDVPHLRRVRVIRYEDFVQDPQRMLSDLFCWLDLPNQDINVQADPRINDNYFARWRTFRQTWFGAWRARRLERKYRQVWQSFGYADPAVGNPIECVASGSNAPR